MFATQRQHLHTAIHERIRSLMNQTPLWLSFTFLMGFFLGLMTILLSFSNYRWSMNNAIRNCSKQSAALIDMKLVSIDSYLEELSDFAILPVYNSEIYHDILAEQSLSADEIHTLFQTMAENYYTRTDLTAYRMDLVHQDIRIDRPAGSQHMRLLAGSDVTASDEFRRCTASSDNSAIFAADDSGSILKFCHTIIRIRDHKPAALITLEVNRDVISRGLGDQIVALYNREGELIYTNASGSTKSAIQRGALSPYVGDSLRWTTGYNSSDLTDTVHINGESYLHAIAESDQSGILLVVWTPLSSITEELDSIRLFSIRQGLAFLILALLITILLSRYLTAPLATLTRFQSLLAQGEYQRISLGRCRETAQLSTSFNDMSEQIDKLVNENLKSSINEKNARIAALEAQVNPHFLYNTLQAIGSEALMNDEMGIYEMLTRLAANMRYSIHGGNEVSLEREVEFTDNYIELQKLRMGERLQVTQHINLDLAKTIVPKCSLQNVVENSIKYGIAGDISCLHLEIAAYKEKATLKIQVSDNGAGMSKDTLREIRERIHSGLTQLSGKSSGIGLANLYSRLQILYGEHADICIESSDGEDHYTRTTLLIPLPNEGNNA
jgi:two-component system sensor histidine kinase YesM